MTLYFRENSSLINWELIHLGSETSWGKIVLTKDTGNYRLWNIHANVQLQSCLLSDLL